jgi:hypothetical protein
MTTRRLAATLAADVVGCPTLLSAQTKRLKEAGLARNRAGRRLAIR